MILLNNKNIDILDLNLFKISYGELSRVNHDRNADNAIISNNKNADKIIINNREYAMRPSIGRIAECEFVIFRGSNGNIIKPDQYTINNSNGKITDSSIIEQKYKV
ncbi:hypothetical protein LY90DRAFT_502864 [Neocallimastix californiae]|uniref:Uncharacterized protein n=1 Tax=Neocallimastix californiae TaxID=1754190 RepID=A0A1Y2ET33_9FUNG|nr:hypothetical protein LY90DRAFT_502864 [Neocallimastix californiae]|eukprot:ORY74005.1 hypothetical protein LY90DRAFT_502864 [Neocallimastix californiae]